jgi:hypothetical protein
VIAIILLTAVVTWWIDGLRTDARISKLQSGFAETNGFLLGQIKTLSNEISGLRVQMQTDKRDAKQDADTRETKAQNEFNAKIQEKDSEINRLITEKSALQMQNDFWTGQSATILNACSNLASSTSITAANREKIDALVGQVQTTIRMVQDYRSLAETNTSLLANLESSGPELQVEIDGIALPREKTYFDVAMPLTNATEDVFIGSKNVGKRAAERITVEILFSAAYTNSVEVGTECGSQPTLKEHNGRMIPDNDSKHYMVTSLMPISSGGGGFLCQPITFKQSIEKPHDYTFHIVATSGGARLCSIICNLHFKPGVQEPTLE